MRSGFREIRSPPAEFNLTLELFVFKMMKVVEMDSCCRRSDLATLNSELNSKSNLARSGLPACQCLSGKHAQRYGYAITRKKRHYSVLGLWRAGNNGKIIKTHVLVSKINSYGFGWESAGDASS